MAPTPPPPPPHPVLTSILTTSTTTSTISASPSPTSAQLPPTPSGALAPAATAVSPASSGSGSGRGRRTRQRDSSVQSRRSAASLGLGTEYKTMNELTSPGMAAAFLPPGLGIGSGGGSAGYKSPSLSPGREQSPPTSRRTSLQFAPPPSTARDRDRDRDSSSSPSLSSAAGSGTLSPLPEHSTPSSATRAPSRKPSLTHLASFLGGITHHSRVRVQTLGVHGGRGVSRSASRSVSRAGSGGVGGGGGRHGSGSGSEEDEEGQMEYFSGGGRRRRRERRRSGGTSPGDEGGRWSDGAEDSERGGEGERADDGAHDVDDEEEHFSFFSGGFGGGTGPSSLSRAGSRKRLASTNRSGVPLSRASSIAPSLPSQHTRSRASSVSSARSSGNDSSSASSLASGAQHPLLHSLRRENTTGGVVPSPPAPAPMTIPSASGGPEVVAGNDADDLAAAGTVRPETWERTREAYRPSTIAPPPGLGGVRRTDPEEEPFLDSAPNSPNLPVLPNPNGHAQARRSVSSAYSALTRTSTAMSSSSSFPYASENGGGEGQTDLSTIDVFDEGERVGVGVWLEGRGGWVRDCFAEGKAYGLVSNGGNGESGEGENGGGGGVVGGVGGNVLGGPGVLEVERRLGEGTYAIVYLVREVLYDPDPTDDDDVLSPIDPLASFDFSDEDGGPSGSGGRPRLHSWASDYYAPPSAQSKPTYGSYFALKCLCKKNLTDELIEVQRSEAFLHRALPKHENIVQMYGAYETDDWLFLVLEYAGGRDAFYWLLEAQEHGTEDLYSRAASPSGEYFDGPPGLSHPNGNIHARRRLSFAFSDASGDGEGEDSVLSRTITADTPSHLLASLSQSVEETPPSPSLLSAAVGDALLSRKRLRLISRMFGQMCAAVQACHDVGISHRDIKPENFIVIDGKGDGGFSRGEREAMREQAERGKGVTIKITDWGLGTMEEVCEDFDCGSKPYMAYECRNNLRPTYDPRQADVWSLGLVFLNLLYHRNPWADPSLTDPDFAEYVDDPIGFLQNRFEGMSDEVATFLSERVFCDVLEFVDGKQRRRVSAGEFGNWASRLVVMMAPSPFSPGFNGFSGMGMAGKFPSYRASGGAGGGGGVFSSRLDRAESSGFDFSPVVTMPLSIPGAQSSPTPGAAGLSTTASLLSQHFAPSTLKASTTYFEEPDLPTVHEIPDSLASTSAGAGGDEPARPVYVTSPSALSEDGDSLPSPTFPSPPPPPPPHSMFGTRGKSTTSPESLYSPLPSAHASPDRERDRERPFVRMPWSSPPLGAATLPSPPFGAFTNSSSPPSTAAHSNGFATPPGLSLPPPVPHSTTSSLSVPPSPAAALSPSPQISGISLLAARRPSLLDPQQPPSTPSAVPTPETSTAAPNGDEAEEGKEEQDGAEQTEEQKAAAAKSKRRKRGARKEKRAAREQERAAKAATEGGEGDGAVSPPRNGTRTSKSKSGITLSTLAEGDHPDKPRRDNVLDDLAAASQELARELSAARTGKSSSRPSASSSRTHGTQSSSAVPLSSSSSATTTTGAKSPSATTGGGGGGMFNRLRHLVNEGNSDLEAFKRRVDERNSAIGAASAPAKMVAVPKGKYDTPFSSRGSVGTGGTASWGEEMGRGREVGVNSAGGGVGSAAGEGKDGKDHWSSAHSRRERLAGRRVGGGGGGKESDFAPSSSSTRGGGAGLSAFEGRSGTATPLSSFGSVGETDWRSGSHSRTRGTEGLAPPLSVVPSAAATASTSPPRPSTASRVKSPKKSSTGRPKLKDASTDTSDLHVPSLSSLSLSSSTPHHPPPSSASAPLASVKSSPRPLPAKGALSSSSHSLPAASPVLTAATTSSTATASPQAKGNKLAKMLTSISVFNRQQGGGGAGGGGSGSDGSKGGSPSRPA